MKTIRITLVSILSIAAAILIMSPSLLNGILPQHLIDAASLSQFPLLGTCAAIANNLISAFKTQAAISIGIVTDALGDNALDEAMALLMVSVTSLPFSLLLGTFIYKPLCKGPFIRCLLYLSLNLVSVLCAWILYRQFFFKVIIEDLLKVNIPDITVQSIVTSLTQIASAAAVSAIVIKIAISAIAAKVVIGKIILPIIGTFIRTILFAFITALLMMLTSAPTEWMLIVPLILAAMLISSLSDCAFGSRVE